LIQWARLNEQKMPDLALLYHVPNGGMRPKGKRYGGEAGKMVGLGQKSGVPDLHLPVPRGLYPGLFIEMKSINGDGKKTYPSKNQRWWIDNLKQKGYRVEVCWTWIEARDVLINYLNLKTVTEP
jgi:hypothetical protein